MARQQRLRDEEGKGWERDGGRIEGPQWGEQDIFLFSDRDLSRSLPGSLLFHASFQFVHMRTIPPPTDFIFCKRASDEIRSAVCHQTVYMDRPTDSGTH